MHEGDAELLDLMRSWDGLGVVTRYDEPTGTWIFVALHDDTLGPPTGGCRMKTYPTQRDALVDAMRLAEGMTHKWAVIDFPFGGGKSVLSVPRALEGDERRGLLDRFAALLNALKGAYGTGEDLGTTPEDMFYLRQRSPYVTGMSKDGDGVMDPGPFTALGTFCGMRAALAHRTGSDDLSGRTVLVQGVGDVGAPLSRLVAREGGTVLVSDLDGARAAAMAEELGGRVVEAADVYETPCDVYAPCAVGATLSEETIGRLECAIVAGSANNQLATAADARRLLERGILYAPDYVINAGGAMAFGLVYEGVTDPAELERRVSTLGPALSEIFEEAEARGESPVRAAERRVERVLRRDRGSPAPST